MTLPRHCTSRPRAAGAGRDAHRSPRRIYDTRRAQGGHIERDFLYRQVRAPGAWLCKMCLRTCNRSLATRQKGFIVVRIGERIL